MQVMEALRRACDDGGHLLSVREALLESQCNLVSSVELQFENLVVTLSVDGDDDTVSAAQEPLRESGVLNSSVQTFWPLCIGKRLQWAWSMTNQQGCMDGVRLEFFDPDRSGAGVIVELIAMASSFEMIMLPRA